MYILILLLSLIFGNNAGAGDIKIYEAMGPSMEPAVHADDKMIVTVNYYKIHPIQHGDIVIFQVSENKLFFKRVIALPGETIKMSEGKVYINGQELSEPYLEKAAEEYRKSYNANYTADFNEYKVPEGCVFVMGDNRPDSTDSRMMGAIPVEKIIGKVTTVLHGKK
jgi:signal peptidase I